MSVSDVMSVGADLLDMAAYGLGRLVRWPETHPWLIWLVFLAALAVAGGIDRGTFLA